MKFEADIQKFLENCSSTESHLSNKTLAELWKRMLQRVRIYFASKPRLKGIESTT